MTCPDSLTHQEAMLRFESKSANAKTDFQSHSQAVTVFSRRNSYLIFTYFFIPFPFYMLPFYDFLLHDNSQQIFFLAFKTKLNEPFSYGVLDVINKV